MDFFGILFDIKNGSKMPYSKNYFDTLFAAKLNDLGVKTLTGALPLTFTTSETALRSWTIYGNNTAHIASSTGVLPLTFTTTEDKLRDWEIRGNDEPGTENLFDSTATDTSKGYASNRVIYSTGQIGVSTAVWCVSEYLDITDCTTLLLRMTSNVTGTAISPAIVFYDSSKERISAVEYNSQQIESIIREFSVPNGASFVRFSAFKGNNTTVELLKNTTQQTAPDHYIPYQQGVGEQRVDGYYVPLTISQTGQTDKTVDIYIGDAPLTAGETVSKTSTGVDLELFEGENTVSTTLYNKPETSITYTDYLGVGEYVNGQWQIPLTVTCDRNLFNIRGNMARSGGIQPIDFNVETSSVTGEMSADSHYILGYANAIVKGDETFVISFDKTTAGTAEMRMMNGTGSSAEIIETFDISAAKSYRVVFECEESFGNVYPWLVATEAATNTFEHIMIKKASDKGGFVPYGAHTDYTIPIEAPLTEGQSVSDTVEITAYEGTNTLDTTLTVKPDATIKFK